MYYQSQGVVSTLSDIEEYDSSADLSLDIGAFFKEIKDTCNSIFPTG